jgi:hypothetical protein
MEEFLRLIATKRVDVRPMISHQFDLAQASAAYDTIMAPGSNSLAVVLKYPEPTASANDLTFTPRRRVELAPAAPKKAGDLKVALVGAGNLARWAHLPNIAKIDGVSLHAVYSASGPRGATYGKRFGAAYACSEYQQILDDRDIDIVLILSRNQQHAEPAEAALRAGSTSSSGKPITHGTGVPRGRRAVEETGSCSPSDSTGGSAVLRRVRVPLGAWTGWSTLSGELTSSGTYWAETAAWQRDSR